MILLYNGCVCDCHFCLTILGCVTKNKLIATEFLMSVNVTWIVGSDELDLVEIVEDLKSRNISLPVVIRFSDILQHRLYELQDCFSLAREKFGYKVSCFLKFKLLQELSIFASMTHLPIDQTWRIGQKCYLISNFNCPMTRNYNNVQNCHDYSSLFYLHYRMNYLIDARRHATPWFGYVLQSIQEVIMQNICQNIGRYSGPFFLICG